MSSADTEIIFSRIRRGEKVNVDDLKTHLKETNEYGQTMLHEAIANSHNEQAVVLVRLGVDVNRPDKKGLTPLHYTAIYNNSLVAELILNNGGIIDAKDEHGNTPLWTAVFNAKGNYGVVIVMMQHGANPNSENNYGRSPSNFAKQIGDTFMMSLLG